MSLEIRTPNKEELEQCFVLRYNVLRKPWNKPRNYRQDRKENCVVFCAVQDGTVIGTIAIDKTEGAAVIEGLAVDTEWRGKGVGTALLKRVEDEARRLGYKRIKLNARDGSVEFYKNNRYVVKRELEMKFGVIRRFRMVKDIGSF